MAEGEQRLALEPAVGAPLHAVLLEGRQLLGGPVEGDRQPAGRTEVAGQQLRHRLTAFAARIPGLHDGRGLRCRGAEGHGAAAEVHQHQRAAQAGQALQQLLLRRREVDPGAVPAREAGRQHRHLLAFELPGQAAGEDHQVGLARGGQGGLVTGAGPAPLQALLAFPAGLQRLHAQGVGPPRLELHAAAAGGPGDVPLVHHALAVEPDAVAPVPLQPEQMLATLGGAHEAAPARRFLAVMRVRPAPSEAGLRLDRRRDRRALELEIGEALEAQAGAGASGVGTQQPGRQVFQRRCHPARAFDEVDPGVRVAGLEAGQQGDRPGRCPVVVAHQRVDAVGVGTDHGDAPGRRLQWQQPIVLQQDQRATGRLQVERAMRGRVELVRRDPGEGPLPGWVEQAQTQANVEQPMQRPVEVGLGQQSLPHGRHGGGGRGGAVAAEVADQVGAGAHRQGHGRLGRLHMVVGAVLMDVGHRAAVRHHMPLELPFLAQPLPQQRLAGARGHAVDRVVGAHHRFRAAFGDRRMEGRQVGVHQVTRRDPHVLLVAIGFGAAVHREVLHRRGHARMPRVRSLQPLDEGHAHARGQRGVLAIGLLAAAPAGVPEDVDVGRPHRQAAVQAGRAVGTDGAPELGAELDADDFTHALHERRVPGRRQAGGLGKHRRHVGARDAVQAFAPPVVGRDAEPRNAR